MIYIDVLFVVNLLLNDVLLLVTSRLSGVYSGRGRRLLGSAVGAVFAVLLFFPVLPAWLSLAYKIALCAVVTSITFGTQGKGLFIKLCLMFCSVSFVFAGAVLALSFLGGNSLGVKNGVPYFNISLKLLLLAALAAYCILGLAMGSGGAKATRHTSELVIFQRGKSVALRALTDTGNLLSDPISGKKVLLADFRMLKPLFPPETADKLGACGENVTSCMEALTLAGVRVSLVPYRSASQRADLLLAFRPDRLTVDGTENKHYLIGISLTPIEAASGCHAIIGV